MSRLAIVAVCWGTPAFVLAQEVRPDTALPEPELRLRLPFELGQGALFDYARHGAEWVGSVGVLPGLSWGELELNALVAGAYTNPRGELLLGGRVSYAVISAFERTVGLRLAVEGSYMVRDEHARVQVGLQPDAAGLLRLGFWGGRDFAKQAYYFAITIGSDVTTWGDPVGAVVQAGPMEDVGDGP